MLSGKTFTFPTDVTIFQKCFLHISQNYFQNQFMNAESIYERNEGTALRTRSTCLFISKSIT